MSDRRQVWATLAELLTQIRDEGQDMSASETRDFANSVEKELRKLGKAQFKSNTLTENRLAQQETIIEQLRATQAENEALQTAVKETRQELVNQELLVAILPALDGLEHALFSGEAYLKGERSSATDSEMLASWLGGLHLIQERLERVLAAGGVAAIPTVGRPFNPFCHKAVGITAEAKEPNIAPNTIIKEERRGYRTRTGILRFAEVIVYRPRV